MNTSGSANALNVPCERGLKESDVRLETQFELHARVCASVLFCEDRVNVIGKALRYGFVVTVLDYSS